MVIYIGTNGNDSLTGGADPDIMYGFGGNDSIQGRGGSDTLYGGAGFDILAPGTGANDLVDGGSETDQVRYDDLTMGVNLDLQAGQVRFYGLPDTVVHRLISIENAVGTNYHDDLAGNAGNNELYGLAGDDYLQGREGDDYLDGGEGDDFLDGGSGNDTLVGNAGNDEYAVNSRSTTVIEFADAGVDTVRASISYTLGDHVENLILIGTDNLSGTGNELDNTITGNAGNNELSGLGGSDTIDGGFGNDTLDGGLGDDSLIGGLGDDTYIVDSVGDTVTEYANEGIDTVRASVSYTLGDHVENLTLTGTANLNGAGNDLNNVITGNEGDNQLLGLGGNDTINGLAGNDTLDGGIGTDLLVGGFGNDTYIINDATDTVIEGANAGNDTVVASVSYTLTANVENLTLDGTTPINGTGNDLNNVITGNGGVNTLDGGTGNDTLIGGAGRDVLRGGAGADRFVFTTRTDGVDRIADFSRQEGDKLVFLSSSFPGLRSGVLRRNQFTVGNRAEDKNDRFIYNEQRGILFYDADGRGGVGQVRVATFADKPSLTARDIIVAASPF